MKSTRRSRRHKNPQQQEQQQKPFFSKANEAPIQSKDDGAFFQPKLTIGKPNDKYEKEADAMADKIVGSSNSADKLTNAQGSVQRTPLATPMEDEKLGTAEARMNRDQEIQEKPEVQRVEEEETPAIQNVEEEETAQRSPEEEETPAIQNVEEEETAQRSPEEEEEGGSPAVQTKSDGLARTASPKVSNQIKQSSGKGHTMPDKTRSEMEAGFGADFSGVNIHTDTEANQLNKAIGAQAFTHGKDVYFKSGKYSPETSSGKHLLAHELTHVVQQNSDSIQKKEISTSHAPQIQRIKTPKLYDTIGYGYWESKKDLAPVYKNTLILLRSQLVMTKGLAEKDTLLKEVDKYITALRNNEELSQKEIKTLISKVNEATPDNKSTPPSNLKKLEGEQIKQLDTAVTLAKNRISTATSKNEALKTAFSSSNEETQKNQSASTAKQNYNEIKTHLDNWNNHQSTKVSINQNASGYAAYNQGLNDNSTLTLGKDAFANQKKLANTLTHEASHGKLNTKDHAYIGAPYFLKLPDEIALDNADHYKFGVELALGEAQADNKLANAEGGASIIDKVSQAKDLTYFKSNKIWMFLMWTKDAYEGKNYVGQNTLNKHAELIGMQDRKYKKAIGKENIQLLITLYSFIKGYLSSDLKLDDLGAGSVSLTPPKDNMKTYTLDNLNGKSIEQISRIIIKKLISGLGLPDDWDLSEIGEGYFDHIFNKKQEPRYQPSDTENQLHNILKS